MFKRKETYNDKINNINDNIKNIVLNFPVTNWDAYKQRDLIDYYSCFKKMFNNLLILELKKNNNNFSFDSEHNFININFSFDENNVTCNIDYRGDYDKKINFSKNRIKELENQMKDSYLFKKIPADVIKEVIRSQVEEEWDREYQKERSLVLNFCGKHLTILLSTYFGLVTSRDLIEVNYKKCDTKLNNLKTLVKFDFHNFDFGVLFNSFEKNNDLLNLFKSINKRKDGELFKNIIEDFIVDIEKKLKIDQSEDGLKKIFVEKLKENRFLVENVNNYTSNNLNK